MDMQTLKYFLAVAECEHVTHAAKALRISQPALTKSMHDLERELGVNLFEHVGRGIRITPAGSYLKQQAEPLVRGFDALSSQMAAFSEEESQLVRLSVLSASALTIDAIAAYRADHECARFSVSQDGEIGCDVFVDTTGGARSSLPKAQLSRCEWNAFDESLCVAVPLRSTYGDVVSLDELDGEGFICLAGSRPFREICDSLCASRGFAPRVAFESDNPAVVQKMIGLGFGVGFWPRYSWGKVQRESVRLVRLSDERFARRVCVGLAREHRTREAERFYAFLVERLRVVFAG